MMRLNVHIIPFLKSVGSVFVENMETPSFGEKIDSFHYGKRFLLVFVCTTI